MSAADDVIARAAEVIAKWYTDHQEHHDIARDLAAAGLLRSPHTEAEKDVIDAARAWHDGPDRDYNRRCIALHDAVRALAASTPDEVNEEEQ